MEIYEKEHNVTTEKNYIYMTQLMEIIILQTIADLDDIMIYEVQRNKQIKFQKH
ncbi:unnamed protein product [Paramecium pentaurelia]|uniref:Uncharacterized protein n=1 Tax=Paramecium pentaurelia TaxID=43138 RepID=A0A8S1VRJ6_9CILI|nr:unnamed protein product [Paramecium pentaurelia]